VSKTKIIALRSPEDSEENWYYMYYEVPENFDLDVEKFEKDFRDTYGKDEFDTDWRSAFDETAKKYGLNKEVYLEVFDLSI
jgi:hypothetical protein